MSKHKHHLGFCLAARCGGALGLLFVGAVFGPMGCAQPENIEVPVEVQIPEQRVVVTGATAVAIGATLTLAASTLGTDDSGYTWASADEAIATVDDNGTVTGLGAGEVVITATGVDSQLAGPHSVVVLPAGVGTLLPYIYDQWSASAHGNTAAKAFTNWGTAPGSTIPTDCGRCHSSPGFQDYLGADGTGFQVVDNPAPVGTTVNCAACHNAVAATLDLVQFPSGVEVTGIGREAICMTCHQGRASTETVEAMILAANGDAAPDEKNSGVKATDIHYYAAGATLEGGRVRGGYQYAGKSYDWRFRHVPGYDTCLGCHDQHTLAVKVDDCKTCHTAVTTLADLENVRMMSSATRDYDGDGNLTEGIAYEVSGVAAKLMESMQAYAAANGLAVPCFDATTSPYWFVDTDGSGDCSADEAKTLNQFRDWTARLGRAAYNYFMVAKDPGGFAHNAKYLIELLYDSIADLDTGVDATTLVRGDAGHFDGSGQPARHWDTPDAVVPAACTRCHGGAEGFHYFLANGTGKDAVEPGNGLDCATCHATFAPDYKRVTVASVTFPSGVTLDTGANDSNMCSTCHSGRESKATVDAAIAQGNFGFRNLHYLPAGATRMGSAAHVGYEFDGKTYAGPWTGHAGGDTCSSCHSGKTTQHTFAVADMFNAAGGCKTCHLLNDNVEQIRGFARKEVDYDNDGSFTEPLKDEIRGLAAELLVALQDYVLANGKAAICYNGDAYPYFFIDTNGDKNCDATESVNANKYVDFDAPMARVTFNYQYAQKEPGAWAHNFNYIGELLYDSIQHVGGNTVGLVRP